jgi:hypothetical protein
MTTSIGGTTGITFNDATTQNTSAFYGGLAMRNRIINGAMVIDQRNAGASVSSAAGGTYFVDRWRSSQNQNSKFSAQQNAGAVTPPAGFTNYLGITSSSAYSVLTGDYIAVGQRVEGFNAADLGWGSAGAQSVTLSFWVRSSLTGTFGGAVANSGSNRAYPFSYTISAANTWEQKTITVAGDTTGTWLTTNGVGIALYFNLGSGATFSGTAGAWAAADYVSATGATSVVGTSGATFYITGVQLEKGSTATSFDYRPYGTELQLAQRYLPFIAGGGSIFIGQCFSSTSTVIAIPYKVTPRVAPTGVTVTNATSSSVYNASGSGITVATTTYVTAGKDSAFLTVTVASGLVSGNATGYIMGGPTNIAFTGCEL